MSERNVRVRFAPSPTGYPHIGNIRTALFNWLFARHSGGSFIVRIEDTDVSRKVKGAIEAILDGLRWLGIDWDEGPDIGGDYGPYFQSQRLDIYQKIARLLVADGYAYYCYCSPGRLAKMRAEMAERKESTRSYDRHCRNLSQEERDKFEAQGITPVVRFKTPLDGETSFNDLIKGEVTFDNSTLDDFVLLKSDGYPTYHLANIVDDHLMEISHVLRADEWLSSTPRHILLYSALAYEPPLFTHLPMILGSDGSKLSKRHGAVSITEYRDQGYLPQAMINFLTLLGWSLDDRTELFTTEELVRHFSLERISKTGAIFSQDKLMWMNGHYIRNMSPGELREHLLPFLEKHLPEEVKRPVSREYVQQIIPLIQERLTTFKEAADQFAFFFIDQPDYEPDLLLGKKLTREAAIAALVDALTQLRKLTFEASSLELALRPLASELGMKTGDFFGLLRVATTGSTAAPPLFQTMAVLGKDKCLKRIEAALDKLRR
ncbi:MAG TPA: glutamate--tRNA ligase [Dehalococcoidia bacterium]|nr:glutamate--tRNA ligase [Dehalococcoidia bacterium]